MKIMHIVGARPNFMKVAPIMEEMAHYPEQFQQILVHTGQHYDFNMSDVFFQDLGMPAPDEFLGVGSGSHAEQTARVMIAFEPIVLKYSPDWVIVVGDVNSTLACALVCAKLGIRIAHVEAGLRSGDLTMPEEINRILTDQLSSILFTPSKDADKNLTKEGIARNKICFVGNVMIDSLVKMLPIIEKQETLVRLDLTAQQYILVTLHRPTNVDDSDALTQIIRALNIISEQHLVVFPIHPRTYRRIQQLNLSWLNPQLRLLEPQGYLDFLSLTQNAQLVLTDSGGVQEETSYLGIPCLTIRPNTERPITIALGTNRLVSSEFETIIAAVKESLNHYDPSKHNEIPYWDGHAASRIVDFFLLESR